MIVSDFQIEQTYQYFRASIIDTNRFTPYLISGESGSGGTSVYSAYEFKIINKRDKSTVKIFPLIICNDPDCGVPRIDFFYCGDYFIPVKDRDNYTIEGLDIHKLKCKNPILIKDI